MRIRAYYIFLFLTNLIFAQQPVTIPFTEKEGLPDVEFYDLLEDSNGYIWLAADKGLFRYNGRIFENFNHQSKRGLSVFGLQEDAAKRIWCNTISGQFFYVQNNKLHYFIDLKEELKGQLPEYVIKDNILYVFYEKGIFEIDIKTKKRKSIQCNALISYFGAPFLFKNEVYFTVSNHIKKIKQHQATEVFQFQKKTILLRNSSFWSIGNTLFFSSFYDNTQHFYAKKNEFSSFEAIITPPEIADKTIIRTIIKDNKIWFCTNRGVLIYKWNAGQLQYITTYLKDETVSKFSKDKNNNYWFTTVGNGVMVMPNIGLKKLETNNQKETIKCLTAIDHFMVYGTAKGEIAFLNTKNLVLQKFQLPSKSEVTQLVYDSKKNVLFISQKDRSSFWDLNTSQLYASDSFTASKGVFYSNSILLSASYDRASVAINPFNGSNTSISKKDFQSPIVSTKKQNITSSVLRPKRAYACFSDFENKNYYIGFVDELMSFDCNGKETKIRYNNQPVFCNDIAQTSTKIIWVSTFANGIYGVQNKKITIHLSQKNGLLSNQVRKIKNDGNLLWIVTENGLQQYDTQNKVFKNITQTDGLENYNISALEVIDNQLFLATNNGLYFLDKNNCFKTYSKPEVYFTECVIGSKKIDVKPQYSINYNQNEVKISFNANGYKTAENIQFQYRLKGYNDVWLQLDSGNNFVHYSSLPSGDFVFEVKAFTHNGIVSKPISMAITIKKPFWEAWWFYVVLSLVVSGGIGLLFKSRIKRLEKEKEIELEKIQLDKELISSQLENLRSQMNPHFIFNALNSIQEYIVTNEKVNASSFLVKFSRLIRMYLEHSRENEIPLEEEITALKLYLELEKDRFEEALDYEIIVDENLNPKTIKIPSIFIQPYVENAIKHGLLHLKNNRLLQVAFKFNTTKDSVICSIKDNGIGRKKAEEMKKQREYLHKSFATSANQKRIELINKIRTKKASISITDLYDKNNVATGTLVQIEIPL